MSRQLLLVSSAILLLGALCAARPARCDDDADKERAKKHFQAGLMLLDTESYGSAAKEFESSVALYPTKNGYFNLANCYLALQRYQEALETINKLKIEFYQELDKGWQKEIAKLELKLEKSAVKLAIHVNVDGATIQVDGEPRGESPLEEPLLVGPGEHQIQVFAKLYQDETRTVILEPGGEQPLAVSFTLVRAIEADAQIGGTDNKFAQDEASSHKEPEKRRIWTWVAYGVGGAAGIAAIVTGGINVRNTNWLKERCPDNTCGASYRDKVDSTKNLGTATNVLIAASATTLMLGTILFFAEGTQDEEDYKMVRVAPVVSPAGIGAAVSGSF